MMINPSSYMPDDNANNDIKLYLLDPLTVIIKLAILGNKPSGTKIMILENIIYFQEPGPFQSLCRIIYKSNKTDLQYLYNPLNIACLYFLSPEKIKKYPRLNALFNSAKNGLQKLIETYKHCSIITIALNYYYSILTNHINSTYNETIFVKDGITAYYTDNLNNILNEQWTDEKIKVVLDIISFLNKNDNSTHNVKSLETIMEEIDKNTRVLINTIY